MRRVRSFLAALAFVATAPMALAFGPLTEPYEIAGGDYEGSGDVLVLDIRSTKDFLAGHIPGAVNTPYGLYRGPKENPGRVPDNAALQEMLRAVGASKSQAVIVVHEGKNATDFGAAARVYWTLKSAGFGQLSILNGGYSGWLSAGGAPSVNAAVPTPSDVQIALANTWMIDNDGVSDVVTGKSEAVLLDARPLEFFEGKRKHGAAAQAGTLAGALNIVNDVWFARGSPRMDAPEEMIERIRAVAAAEGDAPLVSFCNTGHWAATNWFAASEIAGIEGVKLYPESMVGWTLLGNAVVKGTK